MKKISAILFVLICFISCKESERRIGRPVFEVRNSGTLEIDTIVLTDTATIFHIAAFYYPENWIRIDSLTYLQAGDLKYQITGSEGIGLNEEFWMPESGEASFTLFFPPVDRKLKTIDFIESDCDGCFKIYGIDLTGKAGYPEKSKTLPEKIRHMEYDMSGPLPEASFEIGMTRINLHLLGYRKGMDNGKAMLHNARFFPSGEDEYDAVIDENTGTATFEFEQYGTGKSLIRVAGQRIFFINAPGTIDIYIDLQEAGRQSSRYHKTEKAEPVIFFTGTNAAINHALNNKNDRYKLKLQGEEFFEKIAGMNADEFTDYVITQYKNISDEIKQSTGLSNLEKDLLDNENRVNVHYLILSGGNQLEMAYRYKNKIPWEQRVLENFKQPLFTEKQYEVIKVCPSEGSKFLYTESFPYIYPIYFSSKVSLKTITGENDGFLFDLAKAYPLSKNIEAMIPMTHEEKEQMKLIENPFYVSVLSSMEKKMQEQIEAAKSKTGYTVCEIPKVSNEKLFDAIVGNYKGKVVFVDFWATWCGPCRSSIKQMEPLKDKELKNDNLVFLYITGASSPESKWRTMIADIKGEHYKLDEKQWAYVCDQFNIDGIPSYVLVKKDGSYQLRNDLRNHETLKKTLLEEIN